MFSKNSLLGLAVLVLIIVALSVLVPLVSRGQGAGGNPLTLDKRKSFYITKTTHNASQALTACASGYHMASLWEVFDTSNLRYDTQLGETSQDSGFGPPSGGVAEGWIRTGGPPGNAETIGLANCNAWTSADTHDFGTAVRLDFPWDAPGQRVSPWIAFAAVCSAPIKVWCMED